MEIKMRRTRKKPNNTSRQNGFTLLETAIAMVVMMIGGLGIAAVFSYAVKNNTGSRDRAVSLAVAQQEVERLRTLPFNDAALAATPNTVTPTTLKNGGRRYSVLTRIVDTTTSSKTIQVQVTPLSNADAWAGRTVQIIFQRSTFTLGPYTGGL
jgi:Tfp pilus assembly protein PilV